MAKDKPTLAQVKYYIKAAHLELGPTTEDDWVLLCDEILLRAAVDGHERLCKICHEPEMGHAYRDHAFLYASLP